MTNRSNAAWIASRTGGFSGSLPELGVSRATVYRQMAAGEWASREIEPGRNGKSWRVCPKRCNGDVRSEATISQRV
jgi:hypothetical protein